MKQRLLSLLLFFTVIFTIGTAITPVHAATGTKTYRSTRNNQASVVVTRSGVLTNSSVAVFEATNLPQNAKVTKIEVFPGRATSAKEGAIVIPQTLSFSSSRSPRVSKVGFGSIKGYGWTINAYNGLDANATYCFSFNAIGRSRPSWFGPIEMGTWAYNNLEVKVHYTY